jgi:ectoine hydroxylase-related dioxygenase (phytanoyl-CoA dioxygenase family)
MQVRPINPEQILRSLRRDGIVTVEHFLGQSSLEEIAAEFEYLRSHRISELRRRRSTYLLPGRLGVADHWRRDGRSRLERRHLAKIPRILEVFQSDSLRRVASEYLSSNAMFCRKIQVRHLADNRFGSEVHFDTLRALKFMIYLTDTDETNGALRYAPRSHRANSAFRKGFLARGNRVIDIPNVPAPGEAVEVVPVPAPAGTLLIFDTEGFHSAGALLPGRERKTLISTSLPRPLSASLRPPWFTLQGMRESRLNPLRAFAPRAPQGRARTRGTARVED